MATTRGLRNRARAHATAVAVTLLALALRLAADPVLHDRHRFSVFYLAVTVAGWAGGMGPGLVALGLSLILANVFFVPVRHTPGAVVDPTSELLGSGIFVVVCLVVVAVTEAMWRARLRVEQHAAEAEAAEGVRARLAAIVESSDDAIVGKSLDGTVLSWNRGAERIFGYTAEEMIGSPISRLIPEDRQDDLTAILGAVRRGEPVEHYETQRIRKDGRRIDVSLGISPIRDIRGRVVGASKIARDVTDRKRADREREELLAAAERARNEAERALQMVDRTQSITEAVLAELPVDDSLRELVARVRAGTVADVALVLLETSGEDVLRSRAVAGGDEAVLRGLAVRRGESFVARVAAERQLLVRAGADPGELGPLRSTGIRTLAAVPLLAGRRLLGVLCVGRQQAGTFSPDDVRLLQIAAERAVLVLERAAQAEAEQAARRAAEAANRAKDEFLAMLGHELRNPLAAVRNAVVSARLDAGYRDRSLEIARRQTEQLARLVDDLLDVSRITQGRILLRKERIALARVVEQAVEAARPLVDQRAHTLTLALEGAAEVFVDADPTRLEQVVVNVLSNAVKYTPAGGRIDVLTGREDGCAVLRVRDTGIGIEPDMLPRIFDLFAQAERGLDRAEGGLGVGLTVVRSIVELHGGRIEVHSAGPGKGAEFVVRLPAVGAAPGETPRESVAAPTGGRARVLVVEDNADAAESLALLLELLGHQVRMAADGPRALELAAANVPDVMLIDIGLPGMDGYEVARRVREHPALRQVTLVALTGYGRDEDREHALHAGFDHHLVKPVDPTTLQGLVARLGKDDAGGRKPPTVH
jgi:PAS domain S-box-containing protein